MDPYRSDHSAAVVAEAPRDRGIVGDIIAQFADPLAFYRELVQNSIDAGTPAVEIRFEFDEGAGVVRVQVRDRGEGMTRDILENQLLVLFRSTKEKDSSKIGKFGIGFTSVLAPDPNVVVVTTARDGRRLVLHLLRDLTYQLYDAGPATQTGTTVEVDIPCRRDDVEKLAHDSIEALRRWCRHASVPVTFAANLPGNPDPLTVRIDRPLAIDNALVEVSETSDNGNLIAVVGLLPEAAPYVGFFNHGLMLLEVDEPWLGRVAVKLQDARLGHTLSRDDVRRDEHFDRALQFARHVIENELPPLAGAALRDAAVAGDRQRWEKIATAICEARIHLAPSEWWLPLVRGGGQAHAIAAGSLGKRAWVASGWSPLAARVVEQGHPVLDGDPAHRAMVRQIAKTIGGCDLRAIESELTAITPVDKTEEDVALLAAAHELFATAHRAPTALVLAELDGVHRDVLALTCAGDHPHVVDNDEAAANPFGRRPRAVAFSPRHEWYVAARAMDPRAGASLLVRVMLLQHELLDRGRSTLLLERVLDEMIR